MVLLDWTLGGFVGMAHRHGMRPRKSRYEPWIMMAMESFEREMLAFYRRSQFEIVRTTAL